MTVSLLRDKAAALKFLKRIMKKYGRPWSVVTDGLCSYSAAMREIGNADRHEFGRRLNNRAEDSHQPFRRQERACSVFEARRRSRNSAQFMLRSTTIFNQERHLVTREIYKQRRSAALGEWARS
jgi:putative transposase